MSERPNDEPVTDVEALAGEARAFLDAHDEAERIEKVTVIRTSDGCIWVDHDLAPEVAHYLLHVGAHQLMEDERWPDWDEDDDDDEYEDEDE